MEAAFTAKTFTQDNVVLLMDKQFADNYNADQTSEAASMYSEKCHVKVTGPDGAVAFEGKAREEVAGFLNHLRNNLGATDMKFTVTKVEGEKHFDTWDSASMTGTCEATWEIVNGRWSIASDMITFKPK